MPNPTPGNQCDADENDTLQSRQRQQQQEQASNELLQQQPRSPVSRADSILAAAFQSHHRSQHRDDDTNINNNNNSSSDASGVNAPEQQQQQQHEGGNMGDTTTKSAASMQRQTPAAAAAAAAGPAATGPLPPSATTTTTTAPVPATARIKMSSVPGAASYSSQQQQQQQPPQPPPAAAGLQRSLTVDSKASVDSTDSSWFNMGGPLWRLAGVQASEQEKQSTALVVEEQHSAAASGSASPSNTTNANPGGNNTQQNYEYDMHNDPCYYMNNNHNADYPAAVDDYEDIMHQFHPDDSNYARQVKRNKQQRRQRQLEIANRRRPRILGTGPGARLAETIKERMRSRADPNAPIAGSSSSSRGRGKQNGSNNANDYTPPRTSTTSASGGGGTNDGNAGGGDASSSSGGGALYSPLEQQPPPPDKMVRIGDAEDDEEGFMVRNAGVYAQKRVRVVQLLIVGLVGLLLGWLGNFFVGTSCHFVELNVQVGQYGDDFSLHFGLWKYSPADSALSGYKYCYPYAGSHESEAPILARVANLLALLAGTYSLMVLWFYLITGRALRSCWRWAVWMGYLAGLLQFLTLVFFVGHLCRIRSCQWGPAASLALVTSVAWVVLGWELHYQAPPLYYPPNATGRDSPHAGSAGAGAGFSHRDSRGHHGGGVSPGAADDGGTDDYREGAANKDVVLETETVVTLEMADFQGASQEYVGRAFGMNTPPIT